MSSWSLRWLRIYCRLCLCFRHSRSVSVTWAATRDVLHTFSVTSAVVTEEHRVWSRDIAMTLRCVPGERVIEIEYPPEFFEKFNSSIPANTYPPWEVALKVNSAPLPQLLFGVYFFSLAICFFILGLFFFLFSFSSLLLFLFFSFFFIIYLYRLLFSVALETPSFHLSPLRG